MNYKLESLPGDMFTNVAQQALFIAIKKNCTVEFDFNEIKCLVDNNTNLALLYRDYSNAHRMEWKTVGPNCAEVYDAEIQVELERRSKLAEEKAEQMRKEYEAKDEAERKTFEEKTKGIELELSDAAGWQKFVDSNKDPYGACCVEYAAGWAKLMQLEMANGKAVKDCAGETSYQLGFLGITGFMYGCAVSMLSRCWKYGEELRRWHNIKTQVGNEGEKANESGGVLNPALLSIG